MGKWKVEEQSQSEPQSQDKEFTYLVNKHNRSNTNQNRNYNHNYNQNRNYNQNYNRNYNQHHQEQNNYKPPRPTLSVTEKNFPTLNENKAPQQVNTCWGKNLNKIKEEPKEEQKQKLNLNYKIKEPKPQVRLPSIPLCARILYPSYFKDRETFKELYFNEINMA